ncbi:MAG: DUF3105 domain-containing protein [Nocardioidaceae bacterium]|nr:DUF3105 domain-containing protein [Nocardioidaceae bacterium]
MAKPKKDADRRARIEAIRREAERAERRRTLMVVLACALVAVVIIAVTGYALLTRDDEATADTAGSLAASASAKAAGCGDVVFSGAEGAGDHRPTGTPIDYPGPPAFGPHWDVPADFARKFYTNEDRPAVEQFVHNLEHGYTILWYDSTVADDPEALGKVQDIAAQFEGSQDLTAKFIAAPWTSEDGEAFPEGTHVALTHWSAEGESAVAGQGQGDSLYCEQPDEQVVTDFMAAFPYSDSLEPAGG